MRREFSIFRRDKIEIYSSDMSVLFKIIKVVSSISLPSYLSKLQHKLPVSEFL